jgi:SulP family sulfate permease
MHAKDERAALWRESPRAAPPLSLRAAVAAAWRGAAVPRTGLADVAAAYAAAPRECASADLGAGLVVTIMLVPQALAYASLAGMPPVAGFYAAIAALFAYPVFGSSGHQAVGPVALMSLLAAEAVHAAAEATAGGGGSGVAVDPRDRYAQLSYRLALLVGLLQAGGGLLRAGHLINLLSHPVLAAFTSASAVIIASSQLPRALRIAVPRSDYVWQTWRDVGARAGGAHGASVGLFALNLAMFWGATLSRQAAMASRAVSTRPMLAAVLRLLSPALLVVVASTALVGGAGLNARAGVAVLGSVPSGMPRVTAAELFGGAVPFGSDAAALLPSAVMMSLVAYVESASVARAMQAKYGAAAGTAGVDGNRELLGLGLANVAAAVLGGFPVTGGFSRSSVNAEAGARTVAAGAVTGALL